MNPRIQALASLIREKRGQTGKKPVLMLGAGASLSSGVKPTKDIMEDLLKVYGQDLTDGVLRERFDRLWARSDDNTRDMFLKAYLELKPSSGYQDLARLIQEGFFERIITFNFDQLLETSLREVGCNDVLVVVRGEYRDDAAVRKAMELDRPRVKILKMHGGLKGGDSFLFTRTEMHKYPDEIGNLLTDLTRQEIIVCGYAFEDTCVLRAFSEQGGNIYCANPGGAPPNLVPILIKRQSNDWVISQQSGYFDAFFRELHHELTAASVPRTKPKSNPFKFLVSYDVRDKAGFYGRRKLIGEVTETLANNRPKTLHLVGPSKAGKTSFVRAGLIANLNPELFWPIYVRCQGVLETWLPSAIANVFPPANGSEELKALLKRLADSTKKHVLLVLDQFERVVGKYPDTEAGQRQLMQCMSGLNDCALPNLTFVCVGVDSTSYLRALLKARADSVEVPPLAPRRVGAIIRYLARKAGIRFEHEVIAALIKRYEETSASNRPFSLAHVQATCNLLSSSTCVDLASYEKVMQNDGDALDVALNVCDIVSFVEDIPDEIGRNLFRKVMKVIPVESKKVLATYLKDNFQDLFTPPEFAEILAAAKVPGNG